MLYQQGDVLFATVGNVDTASAKTIPAGRRGIVLAEGEVTGHAHCITDTQHAELLQLDERRYLNVSDGPVVVLHEEHGMIEIPTGLYEVRIKREYDHFAEEARNVED